MIVWLLEACLGKKDYYTVVGVFSNSDAAYEAGSKLKEIDPDILVWHVNGWYVEDK